MENTIPGAESPESSVVVRDNATVPVAREIIGIIASKGERLPLGAILKESERGKVYEDEIYGEIASALLKHNVRYADIPFIRSLCIQALDLTFNTVDRTMQRKLEMASEFVFGKNESDLTVGDIEAIHTEIKKSREQAEQK